VPPTLSLVARQRPVKRGSAGEAYPLQGPPKASSTLFWILHFTVQPIGCWNTQRRRRRQVNAVPGLNGTTRGHNQRRPGMRFDPIPSSHPQYRHRLRHGSVQHGLPGATRICTASGLGGPADIRYLFDILRLSTAISIVALGSFSIGVTWYVLIRLPESRFGYAVLAPDLAPFVWPLLLPAVLGGIGWRYSGNTRLWFFPYVLGAVALSILGVVVGFILLCAMGLACM
jgi:hypothetical protein